MNYNFGNDGNCGQKMELSDIFFYKEIKQILANIYICIAFDLLLLSD